MRFIPAAFQMEIPQRNRRGGRIARSLPGLLLLTAVMLPPASAQQTDSPKWLQFIGLELRQLRVELLEQRVAEDSDRLLQIERDLAALRLDQSRYRKEEQSQTQQLSELQKQASDPGADAQAQAHIQTLVAEFASTAEVTRVARSAIAVREAELNERLRTAKTRVQVIMSRLKELTGTER